MFLTITTTGTPERPATDLGFLLHKHPEKAQAFSTSYGTAHVLYPEADVERCTAALLLEVDAVALVRRGKGKGRGGAPDAALAQYVNDRPYAASSLLAVALSSVFSSAMKGVCNARPELPASRTAAAHRGAGAARPRRPRTRTRALRAAGLDGHRRTRAAGHRVPASGATRATSDSSWSPRHHTLAEALRHLYVLLPVLDDAKHYWVSSDEVDKLLRAGEGWLPGHPEQKLITSRYLSRRWSLTRQATERLELVRLAEADDSEVEEIDNAVEAETETEERPTPLAVQRREAIIAALKASGAARVLDLGCGQGQLVQALLKDPAFTEIVGVDVSMRALTIASRRLKLDRMGERQAARVTAPPGLARLHRQPAQGLRRRRAQRGDRTPRPAPAARPGVRGVRRGPPAHGPRDDPERRVQRPLGEPARRPRPARRPPLRVDPRGVPGLGRGGGRTARVRRRVRARGTRRPGGGAAHPDGRVHT